MPLPLLGAARTAPSSAGSPPVSTSPSTTSSVQACAAVEEGKGVLVAAPTGAGKTIVGEFAVHLALATGRKAFYTTPIKALSNQKYHDLVRVHGADKVGLLTGDSSVNGEAPVVVMTTEVLRNMMYAGSRTLDGLGYVVMDEVHYLADRFRGAVWEEVIIHLPEHVQVVSLSATVSNAEEFGDWLAEVRGNHEVVVSEHRPVPLFQHMLVGTTMFDLFAGNRVNPDLLAAIRTSEQRGRWDDEPRRGGSGRGGPPARTHRAATAAAGGVEGPAAAPADAASRAADAPAGARPGPRSSTSSTATGCCPRSPSSSAGSAARPPSASCSPPGPASSPSATGCGSAATSRSGSTRWPTRTSSVLGYFDFVEGLSRGFAAHHAGMLPLFREIVEELFTAAASGPCSPPRHWRSASTCRPAPWCSRSSSSSTARRTSTSRPAEYTQLTGRAGRRGIDVEGHAVVQWARGVDPLAVGGLASTRTYPLRSSFRPTYNMAVNLVAQVGREVAREILETSFAQFQADRAVVGIATTVRRNEEGMEGYAEAMHCHLGDFREYAALRRSLADAEKEGVRARSASRRAEAAVSLEVLRIGDVIRIPAGRRAGWAVVVQPARTGKGTPTGPAVVTEDKQFRRLTLVDVPEPVESVTHVKVPPNFNPKSPKSRRDLADLAADRGAPRLRGLAAPAGPAGHRGGVRAGRAAAPELRRTRATSAPTARHTPGGPSGGGGSSARRSASSARSRAAPTRWRAPSTGSATPSRPAATSPTPAPSSPSGASGCAGSTPRRTCSPPSACATTCGSGSTRRAWPPPCRRWSTSPGTRRPRSPRGCRTRTSPRP